MSSVRACGRRMKWRADAIGDLQKHTRHIISTAEFAKMKRGVVVVNTARGAVIDEAALVKAIEDGIVRSCGLDVYEHEPDIHKGLMDNPNVLLLPHLGTWTYEVILFFVIISFGPVRET